MTDLYVVGNDEPVVVGIDIGDEEVETITVSPIEVPGTNPLPAPPPDPVELPAPAEPALVP